MNKTLVHHLKKTPLIIKGRKRQALFPDFSFITFQPGKHMFRPACDATENMLKPLT